MRGSVFKKRKTWAYRVDIGRDPETGRRQQQMRAGFRLKADAEAALRQVLQRVDVKQARPVSKMPLGDYLLAWLGTLGATVEETTADGYLKAINRINKRLGHVRLCDLRAADLRALYSDMDVKDGLATKTIKNTHSVLHEALAAAVTDGLLPGSPADRVRPGGSSKVKPATNVWDRDTVKRFAQEAHGHRFFHVYFFLLLTGLRRGEALGARWSDVDLQTGRLTIQQTLTELERRKHIDTPKTRTSHRTIRLGPRALELLEELKQLERARIAAAPGLYDIGGDFVFCDALGMSYDPRKVSRQFKPLCKRLGFRQIRVHDLRHTWATLAVRSGRNIKEISAHLGHSTTQITLDLYVHVDDTSQAETVHHVEASMFG